MLVPSKQEVSFGDTIDVLYALTEVEGYHYVGVVADGFDVLGSDCWEGNIKLGETKFASFTLRLKEIERMTSAAESLVLGVTLRSTPFPYGTKIGGHGTTIKLKFIDYKKYRKYWHIRRWDKVLESLKKSDKVKYPIVLANNPKNYIIENRNQIDSIQSLIYSDT